MADMVTRMPYYSEQIKGDWSHTAADVQPDRAVYRQALELTTTNEDTPC